jgi:hypothetical protein
MGVFSRFVSKVLGSTTDIFWWYKPSLYGGLFPICFSRELGIGDSILCFRFCIFDKPILEYYVFQVEGSPHLLKSCLCVA